MTRRDGSSDQVLARYAGVKVGGGGSKAVMK
jgi:hypothetical protein